MRKLFLCSLLVIIAQRPGAQISSMDIRHADTNGPYPIYLGLQIAYAHNKKLFSGFTEAYSEEFHLRNKSRLHGFETNIGVVINERHFLGIKNWLVRGFAVELGYRYLFRNLSNEGPRRLHLQEETISLRLCKRDNIVYPLTYQIQTGPTFYNFYSVRQDTGPNASAIRERVGYGLFEPSPELRKFISGWDLRGRLMLFDPAGTSGGVGYYLEYRCLWTFGKRDLNSLYETFLGYTHHEEKKWDYQSFAIGIIVPIAIRMVSSQ